jgi:hypothetical protein
MACSQTIRRGIWSGRCWRISCGPGSRAGWAGLAAGRVTAFAADTRLSLAYQLTAGQFQDLTGDDAARSAAAFGGRFGPLPAGQREELAQWWQQHRPAALLPGADAAHSRRAAAELAGLLGPLPLPELERARLRWWWQALQDVLAAATIARRGPEAGSPAAPEFRRAVIQLAAGPIRVPGLVPAAGPVPDDARPAVSTPQHFTVVSRPAAESQPRSSPP